MNVPETRMNIKIHPDLAGRQGFEPRYAAPEAAVLPLDDLPTSPSVYQTRQDGQAIAQQEANNSRGWLARCNRPSRAVSTWRRSLGRSTPTSFPCHLRTLPATNTC